MTIKDDDEIREWRAMQGYPPPPADLVDAPTDRVHTTPGVLLGVTPIPTAVERLCAEVRGNEYVFRNQDERLAALTAALAEVSTKDAEITRLTADNALAWSDCRDGTCRACPRCCDAARAEVAALTERLAWLEVQDERIGNAVLQRALADRDAEIGRLLNEQAAWEADALTRVSRVVTERDEALVLSDAAHRVIEERDAELATVRLLRDESAARVETYAKRNGELMAQRDRARGSLAMRDDEVAKLRAGLAGIVDGVTYVTESTLLAAEARARAVIEAFRRERDTCLNAMETAHAERDAALAENEVLSRTVANQNEGLDVLRLTRLCEDAQNGAARLRAAVRGLLGKTRLAHASTAFEERDAVETARALLAALPTTTKEQKP